MWSAPAILEKEIENMKQEKLKCGACKKWKLPDEFHKVEDTRGYSYTCTKCRNKYNKKNYEENKEKIKTQQKKYENSKAKFAVFAHQLDFAESVRRVGESLQVKCAHVDCRKWYFPTVIEVKHRINALNGGLTLGTECRLYCSEDCKGECSIFRRINYQADHPIHNENMRPYYPEWSKAVKEKANHTCERCGSKENLVSHHIKPVKTHPNLVADIDNGVCLCSICDKKAHQLPGCKTGELARKVC